MILGAIVGAALLVALSAPGAAAHHQSVKKGMWGPLDVKGRSAFPLYHRLGVGVFQMTLSWRDVAPTRPADPLDPADPAYSWPATVDVAVARARRHGIRVSVMLMWTPPWANRGRSAEWAPRSVRDLANFATAASRRYPGVSRWMIWGEPTRMPNFRPLDPETPGTALTRRQRRAPEKYARMLDASYSALKRVDRHDLVIGGNSFTSGHISPRNWIRFMRLRDGRRPRMDLYGHNPYTARRPDLSQPLVAPPAGYADFSDLDALRRWLGRSGFRSGRAGPPRLFLSEFSFPTDHPNFETNFYVTRDLQARWTAQALREVRRTPWIATLGWFALLDDPPRSDNLEVNRGLMTYDGRKRKPAFYAFRDG